MKQVKSNKQCYIDGLREYYLEMLHIIWRLFKIFETIEKACQISFCIFDIYFSYFLACSDK